MRGERYRYLMENDDVHLTDEEIKLGWHFCNEFDGLLVPEYDFCRCEKCDDQTDKAEPSAPSTPPSPASPSEI